VILAPADEVLGLIEDLTDVLEEARRPHSLQVSSLSFGPATDPAMTEAYRAAAEHRWP
jgi:hypothetical protein